MHRPSIKKSLNRRPLKILNGIKLILDDQGNHLDSYTISLESFRSFRSPLFRKPVTALARNFFCRFLQQTGSNDCSRLQFKNAQFQKKKKSRINF